MVNLRRVIAIVCVLALSLSSFSFAYGQISEGITQEAATRRIKELFDTTHFDVFNIDYSEYRGQRSWQLRWSQSEEPYASLSATVDARDGNILDLYVYKGYDPQKKTPLVPEIREEEARKIAEEFIINLQPEEFSETALVENYEPEYRPGRATHCPAVRFSLPSSP